MKIKYSTTRETAFILREMAGNCGSSDRFVGAGFAGFIQRQEIQRARPVEEFLTGEVDVHETTPEAVVKSFQNCRIFRRKTIARLAQTITILPVA